MRTDQEIEARLRALADEEVPPSPPADAVAAVVARRARGERVTVEDAEPSWHGMRWWVVGAAAAGIALLVLVPRGVEPTGAGHTPPAAHTDTTLRTDQLGGFLLPAPLAAQATAEPSYEPLRPQAGERLRPGHWFYTPLGRLDTWQRGDTAFGFGIERAAWQGQPAWLSLGGRRLPGNRIVWGDDSLWISRDSLTPLREVRHLGPGSQVEKTWSDSEVLIGQTTNGYTSWESRPALLPHRNPAEGVPIFWYQFLATLQSGELSLGWKRSLAMPFFVKTGKGWGAFLNLEVVRDERVTVPAGTFDCWKVVMGREENGHELWVSKDRGWIVAQSEFRDGTERYRQELVEGESGE